MVAIGVGEVGGAVGGKIELLEPCVPDEGGWGLKFISADVDGAAFDARVAVEISRAACVGVEAGVDAGRVGLEVEIASRRVCEPWIVGGGVHGRHGGKGSDVVLRSVIQLKMGRGVGANIGRERARCGD